MTDEIETLRAELAAERERGDRLAKENNELKIDLAKWVHYWRDKDNKALAEKITKLREALVRTKEVLRRAGNYDCEYQEDIDVIDAVLKETE
jgi:predicted component of type VI protein secretion system